MGVLSNEPYPCVTITQDMIQEARQLSHLVEVDRTKASPEDTLVGILGEFVFAQYFWGDWRKHNVTKNKGQTDFPEVGIEVKTSAFPLNDNLHLLVREDYAKKRRARYYVQVIIDIPHRDLVLIYPSTPAYIVGWATSEEVLKAPLLDPGSKFGGKAQYRCYSIAIRDLHPVELLRTELYTQQRGATGNER